MTSRELTSGFDFWYVVISALPWCIFPYNLMQDIFIQSKVIDIFPKFKMAADAILDFQLCEFGHSGMLVVWYLCSVPNLVQISVIVTEIDAHMLECFRPSFDDVTRINFRFRLLITWSSLYGLGASSHEIWCRYLYPILSY